MYFRQCAQLLKWLPESAKNNDGSQTVTEVYQVISVKLEICCSIQDRKKKLSDKALVSWMLLSSVH